MAKAKKNNNQETDNKKTITVYFVIRCILIVFACSILILGIVARILHYVNNH